MSKQVKNNKMQGFDTDVYSGIREMFHNDEIETYVFYEDKYLRDCIFNFLKDNNYTLKSEQNEDEGCIYVNFEKGYFKTVDEPSLDDKKFYEMPHDWEMFRNDAEEHFKKNPIEIQEEVKTDKKPEGWSEPTAIGTKENSEKESCGTMDKLKEAFKSGDYKD